MRVCLMTAIAVLGFALASAIPTQAREIGFVETFALADDRAAALAQLIPGSQDYYFYHCLHAQHEGDRQTVERLIKKWIDRHGRTARVDEMLNRQALLDYPTRPEASLEHIQQALNLTFGHQRDQDVRQADLPERLDPDKIGVETLTRRALKRYRNLDGFEDAGLETLDASRLNPVQRRDLLRRLRRPDVPNLARLVVDDLNTKRSRGFGSHPVHRQMLKPQLDQCIRLMPDLLAQSRFVAAYLSKLVPGNDADPADPAVRKDYLERAWAFLRPLKAVHNSLKVHILYHLLDHQRRQNHYDEALFSAYLKLPRRTATIAPRYIGRDLFRGVRADLKADFSALSSLPPVGDDTALVEDYLAHFLAAAETPRRFAPYIEARWLKRVFAQTKILGGTGDMEAWAALLDPAEFRQLNERIDIDFSVVNPPTFGVDEPVALDLQIKNVATLIVKVFEINAFNYYREKGRKVDTAITLDGLAATWEKVYRYQEPPLRRVSRRFAFPEIDRPGVFVAEFIGNGKSSRAVIRKGALHFIERATAAGHAFTVFDEQRNRCPRAVLWLGNRRFEADDDGTVTVPYATQPGRKTIVLTAKGRTALGAFRHLPESYRLTAGFHIDAESLIRGGRAQVVIRPLLTVNGRPVSLSLLEAVQLDMQAVDRRGVTTGFTVEPFPLYEDRESVHNFQVPDDLRELRFALRGRIQNLSRDETDDLADSARFSVNGAQSQATVHDLFLSRVQGRYRIEILGKNGEPKPNVPVHLTIKHRFFRNPVKAALQSDAGGCIALSSLERIDWIEARWEGGVTRRWHPAGDAVHLPSDLHVSAGQPVELACAAVPGNDRRRHFSLLERRGGTYVYDRIDALGWRDGQLSISGLAPGDYELRFKDTGQQIAIRAAAGKPAAGAILSGHRLLETGVTAPLQIVAVNSGPEAVVLDLANASPHSRVHAFATRFDPPLPPFAGLNVVPKETPKTGRLLSARSRYLAMRDIGDEYRYVIERQYRRKFPGNMLAHPELLLSPWPLRKTDSRADRVKVGEQPEQLAEEMAALESRRPKAPLQDRPRDAVWGLDFLKHPSVALLNLKPGPDGRLRIDREKLGGHRQLHIVAVDPAATVYRRLDLADSDLQRRDLRMTRQLDAALAFTEQQQAEALSAGETIAFADAATSDFEIYDTLAKVFRLMQTLSKDPTAADFAFLPEWPRLTAEEKREKYGRYACHELNFFLFHKDRPFFDAVVRPFIAAKKDATFLDRWLTGEDLNGYRGAWAFGRLNVLERILLLGRGPRTGAYVKQLLDLVPPDPERDRRLFDIALMGMDLETAGSGAALTRARGLPADGQRDDLVGDRGAGVPAPAPQATAEMAKAVAATPTPPAPGIAADSTAVRAEGKMEQEMALRQKTAAKRKAVRRLYRQLEKTEEWAENNYYHLPIEAQTADLIRVNPFWADLAASDPGRPFLSPHLTHAAGTLTEMLMALALLDLPFEAGEHRSETTPPALQVTAASPMVVYHRQIQPARKAVEPVPVMVGQNYFRMDDRFRFVDNQRHDKFVTGEFLYRTAYGCQVVLSNPASSPLKLQLLMQIPAGAVPLKDGFYSQGQPVRLKPYGTWAYEYYFYFPEPGTFGVYPVQVSQEEATITGAAATDFTVVRRLSRIDRDSWTHISQNGSAAEVLQALRARNVHRLDLDRIAFRMRDPQFFDDCIALLRQLHRYSPTLWSYGIYHNRPDVISQYLPHTPFADRCGPVIASPLLTLDPVARHRYQHLEYKPLINARTHRIGGRDKILNDRLYDQYHRFLHQLSHLPTLDPEDRLAVVYYLLRQGRVETALKRFATVDPGRLQTRLQYDYLKVYLDFSTGQTGAAREVASQYEDYPVPSWQRRFKTALAQLDEIDGRPAQAAGTEFTGDHGELADTEPYLDFSVASRRITLRYRNLTDCTVNYYPMDVELLFSRNPFPTEQTGELAFIRPRDTTRMALPVGGQAAIDLPEQYRHSNVMIEIVAGGTRRIQAHYANSLNVEMSEAFGRLRVRHIDTGQALPATYVKVYARRRDGSVRFYKDGYTDLRGRFDYLSLSTDELDRVQRFSVLILSDDYGATIRSAFPPQR
jgi:hypothetical protein